MAEARLKGKLTLDDSQFSAVLRRQTANAAKFAATVGRSVGIAGAVGFAATTAAVTAASAALAAATKQALELGGKFSDMRAMTGASVKSLTLLSHALTNAGVDGDALGSIINKMQKAIEGGGDAFERMGVNLEELKKLSPDQQFLAIGRAIGGLKTPAEQTAAAMEVFGKSGGTLLAFFKDSNAIANSAKVLGSMPDILDRSAESLDGIDDKIANILDKQKAFNVGFGSKVAPALEPILDKLLKVDTAKIGQDLAADIEAGLKGKNIYDSMGNIARAFAESMQVAFGALDKGLTIALLRGFKEPIAWFEAKVEHIGANLRRLTGQDSTVDVGKIDEKVQTNKWLQDKVGADNPIGKLLQKNIERLTADRDRAVSSGNAGESFDQIYQRKLASGSPSLGNMNAEDLEKQLEEQLKAWMSKWLPKTSTTIREEVTKPEAMGQPMSPEMILGGSQPIPDKVIKPPAPEEFLGPPMPRSTSGVGAFRDLQNSKSSWEKLQEATGFIRTMTPGSAMSQPVSLYSQPNAKGPDGVRRTVVGNQERSKKILGAEATKRKKDAESAEKAQMTTAEGVNKIVGLLGGKG